MLFDIKKVDDFEYELRIFFCSDRKTMISDVVQRGLADCISTVSSFSLSDFVLSFVVMGVCPAREYEHVNWTLLTEHYYDWILVSKSYRKGLNAQGTCQQKKNVNQNTLIKSSQSNHSDSS